MEPKREQHTRGCDMHGVSMSPCIYWTEIVSPNRSSDRQATNKWAEIEYSMKRRREGLWEPILTAPLNPACEPSWLPKHNSANLVDWPRRPIVAISTRTRISNHNSKLVNGTESPSRDLHLRETSASRPARTRRTLQLPTPSSQAHRRPPPPLISSSHLVHPLVSAAVR
jgi:hypothetical protein